MATLVDIIRLLSSITMQRCLNDIQNVFESTPSYLIISVDFFTVIKMLKKNVDKEEKFSREQKIKQNVNSHRTPKALTTVSH